MNRLNLGSGWHRLDGWTNVDLHHDADIQADIRTVEFDADSVDAILCVHAIEHISATEGAALIARCYRWLRPGGSLAIETPDRAKCLELIMRRPIEGAKGLMGGRSADKPGWQAWLAGWVGRGADRGDAVPDPWNIPGEAHVYVWTDAELAHTLSLAGFCDIFVETPFYHGQRGWRDSRVTGRKPGVVA